MAIGSLFILPLPRLAAVLGATANAVGELRVIQLLLAEPGHRCALVHQVLAAEDVKTGPCRTRERIRTGELSPLSRCSHTRCARLGVFLDAWRFPAEVRHVRAATSQVRPRESST